MSTEQRARAEHAGEYDRRRWWLLAVIAVGGLIADQVTKIIAVTTLEPDEPVRVLGGLVYFQIVRNPSAAFGLGAGMTPLLTVFAILVVAGIIWFARRVRSTAWIVGLGLVLAGALGNLTDRIFRPPGPFQGHVIDFLSVFAPNGEVWPVFNVADSCICVGAILIVLLSLLGRDYDGSVRRKSKSSSSTPGGGSEESVPDARGEPDTGEETSR